MYALFEEGGKFLAGRLMAEADSSVQVELDSGKRVKVKAANVLLRFDAPQPAELFVRAQSLKRSKLSGTEVKAARWTTRSLPATAASTAEASRTSARRSFQPGWRFSAKPVDRSSRMRTSQPSRAKRSATWEPMNPAPPVTRTQPWLIDFLPPSPSASGGESF